MKPTYFLLALVFLAAPFLAHAEEVGSVSAKGGFFSKDHITILAFDDPDIGGVTCYTTYYDRAWSASDSSSASLSCRKTGPLVSKGALRSRANVFSTVKGWRKKTVVDRFYDASRGVLVYLTYTKGAGKNASHSISVVTVR